MSDPPQSDWPLEAIDQIIDTLEHRVVVQRDRRVLRDASDRLRHALDRADAPVRGPL